MAAVVVARPEKSADWKLRRVAVFVAVWVFMRVSAVPGDEEATLTVMVVVARETVLEAWRFATVRFAMDEVAPLTWRDPETYAFVLVEFVEKRFEMVELAPTAWNPPER